MQRRAAADATLQVSVPHGRFQLPKHVKFTLVEPDEFRVKEVPDVWATPTGALLAVVATQP